jgi:GGDEF domain-containing protein
VISIKKFMTGGGDERLSALTRTAALLLEGIAVHAVECDPAELNSFQISVRKLRHEVEAMASPSEILVSTGATIKVMETYNRGIERFIRVRGKQYEEMLAMLSQALIEISHAGDSSVQNLQKIEKDLHSVTQIDDLRELKLKLSVSLKTLSKEIQVQEEDSKQFTQNLEKKVRQVQAYSLQEEPETDSVTGLSGHIAAARGIADVINSGKQSCIAVFCVERLPLINSQFGSATGDQVLRLFSDHLAQKLSSNDHLFRWRGPVFLAIMNRRDGVQELGAELKRNAPTRIQHNVSVGARTVLISISSSWSLLRTSDFQCAEDLLLKVDAFAALQSTGSAPNPRDSLIPG